MFIVYIYIYYHIYKTQKPLKNDDDDVKTSKCFTQNLFKQ